MSLRRRFKKIGTNLKLVISVMCYNRFSYAFQLKSWYGVAPVTVVLIPDSGCRNSLLGHINTPGWREAL